MTIKYDLKKMLAEIEEDKKVFESKPHYWASQDEIKKLASDMRSKRKSIAK